VAFFEPEPSRRTRRVERPAPWAGPPVNELPATAALGVVIARSDSVAISVGHCNAYREGFELTARVILREPDPTLGPFDVFHWQVGDALRFGVEFADGRKATNQAPGPDSDEPPSAPVLLPREGGGGTFRWWQIFWLWPLPPAGEMTIAVEWPVRGVPLSTVRVETEPILAAAARAIELWPPDEA
jgi:hypothetical protein